MRCSEDPASMEKFYENESIDRVVELLPNQLYFVVLKDGCRKKPRSTQDTHFFCIDEEFVYQNYYNDFGPLNISCVFKYCCKLNKLLRCCRDYKHIVHYTDNNLEKKTNAACLIGLYAVLYLRLHPKTVCKLLYIARPYRAFVDASQYCYPFEIRLVDVFNAMAKAVGFNFVNFLDFNETEYDTYNKFQYGDMNWLLPRKFLAFIGPMSCGEFVSHPPNFYIKYFLKNNIRTVIRLNNKTYDETIFKKNNIDHYDLIFPDGTTPPKDILLRFLQIAENTPMAIAVHCKAGLGRTGSLIAAYIMKHFRFSAKEAISWLRLCRPGCVIGQQQLWLEKIEHWLWRTGKQHRMKRFGDAEEIPRFRYGIYSRTWPLERNRLASEAIANSNKKTDLALEKRSSEDCKKKFMKFHKFKKKHTHTLGNEPKQLPNISKLLSSVHGFNDSHSNTTASLLAQRVAFLKAEANSDQGSMWSRKLENKSSKLEKLMGAATCEVVSGESNGIPCVHRAVQGDSPYRVDSRVSDYQQTCIERYSQQLMHKNKRMPSDLTCYSKKLSNRNRSACLPSKRPAADYNTSTNKARYDTELQGDKLLQIKVNKMYNRL